ncbi:ABC-type amino acid transport substrate-binding protein [Pseudoduganella flava]|uniref:ABC-type amino acid transport substrate-binding protein n=1 Tax=Pseudoduganella flava TaxID=871742 RepID=A0A562P6T5_9BURK|nr:transporter substrate-binding domain-containing protein [Pseudoduganella flava]TWI40138.1 ABC-type amino acid transport substrate-binding protein [Pseudoduganella flava]
MRSTDPRSPRRALVRWLAAAPLLACGIAPAYADWERISAGGSLKVAVYEDFAPFSNHGSGIDVALAQALARRLSLKLQLLPFPAGENLDDDLRNMVWKGHYLGYGPADVMLHVPVDRALLANDKVRIFAPYHVETVRLVRDAQTMPAFAGIDDLAGKRIGVEQVSLAAMLLLGEGNGRLRDNVHIFPSAALALQALREGRLDAVLANRSEIEAALRGDPHYPLAPLAFARLPRDGWAVGMAVRKDDTELARRLQAALNDMTASGELGAIFAAHGVQVARP